jgi:hypothetical protein
MKRGSGIKGRDDKSNRTEICMAEAIKDTKKKNWKKKKEKKNCSRQFWTN